MKQIFVLLSVVGFMSCSNDDKKATTTDQPQGPLGKSPNTEVFNQSFGNLLHSYYSLKDAFIKEDTTQITKSAQALLIAVDSLKVSELKGDSSLILTISSDKDGLSTEIKGLLGEKGIEAKRASFKMATEFVYGLFRSTHYDREKMYKQYCPMAFDNKGAEWLSNSSEIQNPYLPKKMLDCGEVKDSVDYRPKQ